MLTSKQEIEKVKQYVLQHSEDYNNMNDEEFTEKMFNNLFGTNFDTYNEKTRDFNKRMIEKDVIDTKLIKKEKDEINSLKEKFDSNVKLDIQNMIDWYEGEKNEIESLEDELEENKGSITQTVNAGKEKLQSLTDYSNDCGIELDRVMKGLDELVKEKNTELNGKIKELQEKIENDLQSKQIELLDFLESKKDTLIEDIKKDMLLQKGTIYTQIKVDIDSVFNTIRNHKYVDYALFVFISLIIVGIDFFLVRETIFNEYREELRKGSESIQFMIKYIMPSISSLILLFISVITKTGKSTFWNFVTHFGIVIISIYIVCIPLFNYFSGGAPYSLMDIAFRGIIFFIAIPRWGHYLRENARIKEIIDIGNDILNGIMLVFLQLYGLLELLILNIIQSYMILTIKNINKKIKSIEVKAPNIVIEYGGTGTGDLGKLKDSIEKIKSSFPNIKFAFRRIIPKWKINKDSKKIQIALEGLSKRVSQNTKQFASRVDLLERNITKLTDKLEREKEKIRETYSLKREDLKEQVDEIKRIRNVYTKDYNVHKKVVEDGIQAGIEEILKKRIQY